MPKHVSKKATRPAQHQQSQPGQETKMKPRPKYEDNLYQGSNKLKAKTAIITGGDSGIGRAIALYFAKEGANVVIAFLNEKKDANKTKSIVEKEGKECLLIQGDISNPNFCRKVVEQTYRKFAQIDILVNNAGIQFPEERIENITNQQLHKTFATNFFSFFYMTKQVLKYMKEGGVIINTTSITAYKGHPELIDYSSTKGAIVTFTRSLSGALIERGIRVNAVAPGPVWTPLIPSSFKASKVATFGSDTPMGRAGQPEEIAPCYVFLASDDSSFMTGQVLHPNGGQIING
jgi:NAD(P)-dependent dehydrogenase (short-subunit alcohol dehydrogenase family)